MSSPDYRRWSRRIQRRSPSSSPLDNVVLSDAELASEEQEEADDGTAEAVSQSSYPLSFMDYCDYIEDYFKKYPEMVRLLRSNCPEFLEMRQSSAAVALLEEYTAGESENVTYSNCDMDKLQLELETLLVGVVKRKAMIRGVAGIETEAAPSQPQDVEIAAATVVESNVGRGCRQKKKSLRLSEHSEEIATNSRRSHTPKIKEELVEVEEEPEPDELKKAETRKEFNQFVDTHVKDVTSNEVENINHLWHLGKYEYSKNEVCRSIISSLYGSATGYSAPEIQHQPSEQQHTSTSVGPGKPTTSTGDAVGDLHTSVRRDQNYTGRLEREINTINKMEISLKLVLVNPDNWPVPVRPVIPPFPPTLPLKIPLALLKQGQQLKLANSGQALARKLSKADPRRALMESKIDSEQNEAQSRQAEQDELEKELECARIVNAVNLLKLKITAEDARDYTAVKSSLNSLDKCIIELQLNVEQAKKRIKDFGDEDGKEAANLKALKEAGKYWIQCRKDLCVKVDIMESKLFPREME